MAAAVVLIVLAASATAVAVRGGDRPDGHSAAPAATRRSTTTTTEATTTTTAPTTTTTVAVPPQGLVPGASGPQVAALQQRLKELYFDPGPVDGRFGRGTTMAVWAFQKLHRQPLDARVSPELWQVMQSAATPAPMMPGGGPTHVEIDLARQILVVYKDAKLHLVTHISTGNGRRFCEKGHCGVAVTPGGSYRFTWRQRGWRTSDLGRLYNPVYFVGGIAIHGSTSVPPHPASHGCVRIPMHIAQYFPDLVQKGDPVYVFGGRRQPTPLTDATTTTTTTTTTASTTTTSTSTIVPADSSTTSSTPEAESSTTSSTTTTTAPGG